MSRPLRVIQFSTGNVGQHTLRSIIGHPDLELVGLHASSPSKVGSDAADLCGISEATGVIATDDLAALVSLGADCVVYTSQAETRPQEALAEITAFLAAGTNVVGTSLVWLVYPPHADAWLRDPIEAACAVGNSTMYVNGIDPGFSGDLLPLAALSLTERADHILVQEVCDYGSYDDAEFTGVSFGFGASTDAVPALFLPGVLASIWGGPIQLLADELGVVIDEMRERHETWVAVEPIDCTMMRVEPGQVAAVRFAVEGIVDGRPAIVMEHVNRLTDAAAPDWPTPPEGRPGVHRVVVSGHPGVEINTHVGLEGVDHNEAGVIATGAKAVNAVAAVCAAPPGLVSLRDLPISQVHGLYARARSSMS
ncbi:MAG: dihydrodipicolinate reductase [Actinomycetota bacterium]|nr:dihydrodipicolinate reductase [Actinomycetota bacterium]